MAEATMAEIVEAVTTLLKAQLSAPVEQYWRAEPPTVLTLYVQPKSDSADTGLYITNDATAGVFKRYSINVIIESPWADGVAGYEAVDAARETVRTVVQANRDLAIADKDSPADGSDDGCTYQYVRREGLNAPQNWAAFVTASWRV